MRGNVRGEKDIELAPGYPASKVEELLKSGETKQLVKFLRKRYKERFFRPIKCLRSAKKNYEGYGFSIMALCCLLIETIQCYRVGLPTTGTGNWKYLDKMQNKKNDKIPQRWRLKKSSRMSGQKAFHCFFAHNQEFFLHIDGVSFYKNIRNGLLHQAQTKGGWTINVKGSEVCDLGETNIHRDFFAQGLEKCFKSYLRELSKSKWEDDVWEKAAAKIWWLIRISKA